MNKTRNSLTHKSSPAETHEPTPGGLHEPSPAELNAELHKAIFRIEKNLNRLLDAGMATQIIYGGIALLIIAFV